MQIFPPDLFSRSRLAAELLGLAVQRLFPEALLIGGGVHTFGFFYDFIFRQPFMDRLVFLIEGELRAIIKEAIPLRWLSMMRENAQTLFDYHHQPLLAHRVAEEPSNVVELIQVQNFYGLCQELPFSTTEEAGFPKLLKFEALETGEREGPITRLVGTSQATAKELKVFLKHYDLLLKRKDHRKLGPQLNLFHFSEPGDSLGVFWHPKGVQLWRILLRRIEAPFSLQTLPVSTPLFEKQRGQLRASLLNSHLNLLKRLALSGADFPLRLIEEGTVYYPIAEPLREGLLSSCQQTVIQRTIGCLKEESVSELISSLHFIEEIIKIFGFEAEWAYLPVLEGEGAQELRQAIEEYPFFYPCVSTPQQKKKGTFSRLELRIQDMLGRIWLLSAIEVRGLGVDQSKDLSKKYLLISQQLLSSVERLIALLLEKEEGHFPLWLAPEQARLLVIGKASLPEGERLFQLLKERGVRITLDKRSSKLNERIFEGEREQDPLSSPLRGRGEKKRKASLSHKREKIPSAGGVDRFRSVYRESKTRRSVKRRTKIT